MDMDMSFKPSSALVALAVVLALSLLAATLAWRIPFMLFDHLDFAQIYAGWLNGSLAQTIFFHVHGGHLHVAAYAVLLVTTWASHGQTWADCLASWVFLCLYALCMLWICRHSLRLDDGAVRVATALVIFLTLYPGHLPNLQWGWQVAVFLCLFGAVAAIACLTAQKFTWTRNFIAIIATGLALASFATGLALGPIALVAIFARRELSWKQRFLFALPWLASCLFAAFAMRSGVGVLSHFSAASLQNAWEKFQFVPIARYTLDYLGSGIARFSPETAPWLAVAGLISGIIFWLKAAEDRAAWPWLALLSFGFLSAGLTALARFNLGESGAFVGRYVSFSSVFWIGWVGLTALAAPNMARKIYVLILLFIVAALAAINAVAMAGQAQTLSAETFKQAEILCEIYPNVDRAMLEGMHYAGADAAAERLRVVHELGFPPFDKCPPKN